MRQYKVQGEGLYLMHCDNCHQADGSGLGRLIPPLSENTTIANNRNQIMCVIKYGLEGSLIINGVEYNGKMPGNTELTNLEIAEIMTFVGNSWENSIGIVLSSDVEKGMDSCH
ncbi:cytochrome c [Reichenbachiella sp. MALMAid0571]|uniref:c-type cytochrome n=1 Tax=Reichenbachiella sp. MALMAid0571 TaxID=3143939 RepID=UPI0032DF4034